VKVSNDSPVLLDRFLDVAIEVDVDAICDGEDVLIGGIMEHVEQAGVHSGDSGCSLPPNSLSAEVQGELREQTRKLAKALSVIGLMNLQFAIQNGVIYVLEVNPRASRTVPFVSKATGIPLAKVAARVMTGKSLREQGQTVERIPPYFSVKEAVFPFNKFPEADPILAQMLMARGFEIAATGGTALVLEEAGIVCRRVNKVREGRPHVVDMIKNDEVALIVNTTEGKQAVRESRSIRREAVARKVTYYTTVNGARATCDALDHLGDIEVNRLQDLHKELLA
jgi:carbamoyl-phosphate synthase large subunit